MQEDRLAGEVQQQGQGIASNAAAPAGKIDPNSLGRSAVLIPKTPTVNTKMSLQNLKEMPIMEPQSAQTEPIQ